MPAPTPAPSAVSRQPVDTRAAAPTPPDVPQRLAAWLLDALGRGDDDGAGHHGRVVLAQAKRALAAELGASPEALSRALARLRHSGCIAVQGCTIDVLDGEGLHRVARRALPRSGARGGGADGAPN